MLALTIWQPWATLAIEGVKPWEWRGHPLPAKLVGQRIVIHAGKRPVRMAEVHDLQRELRAGDTSLLAEALAILDRHRGTYPLGVGLGTATLGAPLAAAEWVALHGNPRFHDSDRVEHSRWAWPLAEVIRWRPPVPARGGQGFWEWPYPVITQEGRRA